MNEKALRNKRTSMGRYANNEMLTPMNPSSAEYVQKPMKIFISWSGERSRKVAELLDEWIQCVIQAVDPWISSRRIDKGSLWFTEISQELADVNHGIICLTKSNMDKPWILFEAGAIVKGLSKNRAYTFLIDLQPSDIKDPLAKFNHTLATKEEVFKLLLTINHSLGELALRRDVLERSFDAHWETFEKEFDKILKSTKDEDIEINRSDQELLADILSTVRGLEKDVENKNKKWIFGSKNSPGYSGRMRELGAVKFALEEKVAKALKRGVPEPNIIALLLEEYSTFTEQTAYEFIQEVERKYKL